MFDKCDPSSYNSQFCNTNGIRLHYVDENSSSKEVLILIHGWPDLWLGWREQIGFLVNLGYRVIVPTLRGFGESESPADPSQYGFKTISKDLAGLLDHLQIPTVTTIGHDWGGFVVWRFAQYFPERVKAIASFCTPYAPRPPVKVTLEDIVKKLPNFQYQLYLNTPEAEEEINAHPREFYAALFRPVGEQRGRKLIDPKTGKLVKGRPVVEKSDLVPQKVLDYYVEMIQKHGSRGGLNWYKQTSRNWDESEGVDPIITKPSMIVLAERDAALPPSMADNMEEYVPNLERRLVKGAGHWILWEKPEECNHILAQWLKSLDIIPSKI
ncbi:Alpha/Beta hydrolase protein [Phycomyces nitens]|nr:Alpha/Beta hydrolase protein [Phycomyces nitens]